MSACDALRLDMQNLVIHVERGFTGGRVVAMTEQFRVNLDLTYDGAADHLLMLAGKGEREGLWRDRDAWFARFGWFLQRATLRRLKGVSG